MDRVRFLVVLAPFSIFLLSACDEPTPHPVAVDPASANYGVPGLPPNPTPLEFSFMPNPDGYQFSNFGGAADWPLFQDVFGGQVNFWSILDRDFYYNVFAHAYGGGQCYGFAVTAGMFYRGVYGPHPSEFQRGASTPFQIVQKTRGPGKDALDEDIERHISKYFFYQADPVINGEYLVAETPGEASNLLDPMEEAEAAGWEDLWVNCAFGPHFGHCVNLIGVTRTETGGIFWIYNNNNPYREDTNNPGYRTFEFTPSAFIFGDGAHDVNLASVGPVSAHEKDHLNKWWGSVSQDDFWEWVSRPVDPDMFVVHIDGNEHWLGRTASAEFDDIPGGRRVHLATGNVNEDWVEPIHYYLPPGDYTIELRNPTTGALDYHLLAGDALFALASPGNGPSEARVTSIQDTRAFLVEAGSPMENLSVKVAQALSQEEERAVEISGLSVAAESRIQVMPVEGAGRFQVELEGMELALANLTITEASPAGILSVQVPHVEIPGEAWVRVEAWDWSRLSDTPVFLETAQPDGTVAREARHVTSQTLAGFLDDLVASGALPNPGIATSIRQQVERAPREALMSHLESLLADGVVSPEVRELILMVVDGYSG